MSGPLNATRTSALFDILSHHDTYAEIRDLRFPGALKYYGPPFASPDEGSLSASPALQKLVSNILVSLPGLRSVSDDFWREKVESIIENFAQANLSESYDKGAVGLRRTLATALSALIEFPVRGTFGGFAQQIDDPPQQQQQQQQQQYDLTSAEDLARAFQHFMSGCVYGTALEDVTRRAAETDKIDDHTDLVKGFHEYVLVNLASFLHFALVLSPKGQYLLKLIENANKLVPYLLIRQTLKMSNVATMINAMVKIVLAKMSFTGVTNWIGLTKAKDDGMNLLQYIISTVLYLDIRELEGRASKIKREPGQLDSVQLEALKDYASRPRAEQERLRQQSHDEGIPLVNAILRSSSSTVELASDVEQQSLALEYLSLHLSIRDRREIIRCLCHSYPDRLTTAIRQAVDAYEPNIRSLHDAVDLSASLGDLEAFIRDIIQVARVEEAASDVPPPTVADFVAVNRRHEASLHRFLHHIAKNAPELTSVYMAWAKRAAALFRTAGTGNTNKLAVQLDGLFNTLDPASQQEILPILDRHAAYMDARQADSLARLQEVIKCCPAPSTTKQQKEKTKKKKEKASTIAKGLLSPSSLSLSSSSKRPPPPPSVSSTTVTSSSSLTSASSSSGSSGRAPHAPPPPPPAAPADAGTFSLSRLQRLLQGGDSSSTTTTTTTTTTKAISSPGFATNCPADRPGPGPGAFLAQWQDLLDQTGQTAATATATTTTAATSAAAGRPDATAVHERLGPGFRAVLAEANRPTDQIPR